MSKHRVLHPGDLPAAGDRHQAAKLTSPQLAALATQARLKDLPVEPSDHVRRLGDCDHTALDELARGYLLLARRVSNLRHVMATNGWETVDQVPNTVLATVLFEELQRLSRPAEHGPRPRPQADVQRPALSQPSRSGSGPRSPAAPAA